MEKEKAGNKNAMVERADKGTRLRVRLASDLHTEFRPSEPCARIPNDTDPRADVLVLAGDIGHPRLDSYTDTLRAAADEYDRVIVVMGNHEYYDSGEAMDAVLERARRAAAAAGPNVHLLDRGSVVVAGVRFLGATLWSDPSTDGRHIFMNDFQCIHGLTLERYAALYRTDRDWLRAQLFANDPPDTEWRATVVVTHYLPSFDLIADRWKGHPLNTFFASALDGLVERAQVWCCGHTHSALSIPVRGTTVYVNPRGYPNEDTGFDPHQTFTV